MANWQKLAFAKRGVAATLAVTLVSGMSPALALAQSSDVNNSPAIEVKAQEKTSDNHMVEGEEYTVDITWGVGMGANFFETKAQVSYEDGSYTVKLTIQDSADYSKIGDITYKGTKFSQNNGVYTITGVESVKEPLTMTIFVPAMGSSPETTVTIDYTQLPNNGDVTDPTPGEEVDTSALEALIASADGMEQGKKTNDAWSALQAAIEQARVVLGDENVTQDAVSTAVTTLQAAITTFNASADIEDPAPSENEYGMEVGKTYTASVSYVGTGAFASMNEVLQQMVSKYFGSTVEASLLEDGTYDVVVYFGGSAGYDDVIGDITYDGKAIKQSSDRTYTINVASLAQAIELGLYVGGSMNTDITYAMTVDTSTLAEKAGEPGGQVAVDKSTLQTLIDQAAAITQGKKADAAWESFQSTLAAARAVLNDVNASQDAVNQAAASLQEAVDRFSNSADVMFQVGHTYQVPMALFKHDSLTEKSMAAQYFGDTALVRPQADGTFKVSFAATDKGLGYISWLKYNGVQLSQSGNQFTMTVPASESDIVLPIEMSISMMQQSAIADLHLYLSQAKDLGVDKGSLAASSSNLAQTGDSTTGLVTLATLAAGAAVAAGAAAARRRSSQRK